jgi:hypothetical protein
MDEAFDDTGKGPTRRKHRAKEPNQREVTKGGRLTPSLKS